MALTAVEEGHLLAVALAKEAKEQIVTDFRAHDADTGSAPVQIALLSRRINELTEHFKQNTLVDRGRYREVKPDIVLEVAFNAIQPSARHASGLALRFPRIKAIRRDKTIENIDTLAYAQRLAGEQHGEGKTNRLSRA